MDTETKTPVESERNPNDATFRNINALKKRMIKIETAVKLLAHGQNSLPTTTHYDVELHTIVEEITKDPTTLEDAC